MTDGGTPILGETVAEIIDRTAVLSNGNLDTQNAILVWALITCARARGAEESDVVDMIKDAWAVDVWAYDAALRAKEGHA